MLVGGVEGLVLGDQDVELVDAVGESVLAEVQGAVEGGDLVREMGDFEVLAGQELVALPLLLVPHLRYPALLILRQPLDHLLPPLLPLLRLLPPLLLLPQPHPQLLHLPPHLLLLLIQLLVLPLVPLEILKQQQMFHAQLPMHPVHLVDLVLEFQPEVHFLVERLVGLAEILLDDHFLVG